MTLSIDHDELIHEWKTKPAQTLSGLYKESFDKIYRYIYFRVFNEENAQDVTEEVYLKLMKQLDHYDGRESISSWLYQIARTEIADFWRENYRKESEFIDEMMATQDEMDEDSKALEKVEKVMKQLPENYSKVLDLRFLKGYTLEECAKELGYTVSNISVLQYRALKKAGELSI